MIITNNIFPAFTWSQIHEMDEADRKWLHTDQEIPHTILNYAIDPYESARMEYAEQSNLALMIFDVVTPTSNRATTEPVSFLFNHDGKHLYTFTRRETAFVNPLITNLASDSEHPIDQLQPLDVILQIANQLTKQFMTTVLDINRRRNPIQSEIRRVKHTQRMIDNLMDLQTALIYLGNSITTDLDLINNLSNHEAKYLTVEQQKHLNDLQIELKQALDVVDLSHQVTDSVSNAYENVANSNLNWTMKILTVWSIILTVPTIVSGFLGQNVPFPLYNVNGDFGWIFSIIITLLLMGLTTFILWLTGFLRK
ncbi:magnesium and cobalt transport protein corA [Weissella oryzae SG25]|uniref:Magnesium and cobalt transport protein corA n=1 Tax=Weissella oryzae (strain DSM 25784 / JCM 18191 / LMG 30913 / SG25) TaxID=1329250 RepID=A0A069CTX7_WEIOS|nr:magnesium transporter CorA family protein [Weissella oryzae]GAK30949.1 magnesium and cobalt transport protein corA [Weissella oryzae SG25]